MFLSNQTRQWETHLLCEIQVALNDMAFSVSEISVLVKYHRTCLACAHVYVGCGTMYTNEQSSEGNGCQKSKVRYPTISLLWIKDPLEKVTMSKYPQLTKIPFLCYQIWVLGPVKQKNLSLHWQLRRESSCCVPITARRKLA